MEFYSKLLDRVIPERAKLVEPEYINEELYYLECNPQDSEYMYRLYYTLKDLNQKVDNVRNSALYFLLGMSDQPPKTGGCYRTATTMPDIDYDTDGRDAIKEYLVKKHGVEHVTLIGTYGSLKTKGAVKDIIRVLEQQPTSSLYPKEGQKKLSGDDVSALTAKFEVVKRLDTDAIKAILTESQTSYHWIDDFSSEIAYFYACLEAEPTLKKWFAEHQDVQNILENILGNVKSTGIHAGGIIVSRAIIPNIAPLSYSKDEGMYITQQDMGYSEESGLIKYDFLGLKTLADINRCLRLVNERHEKKYNTSNIPMKDPVIFDLFVKGKTESVFQFSTGLAVSIITKLKYIRGIKDLAMITSIARPGPLGMQMDKTLINVNTGVNEPKYIHPSLEKILHETFGIICYQEQIIIIAQIIGRLDSDSAVDFMKALSKKKLDKVQKYAEKLKKNAMKEYGYSEEQAKELYDTLEKFASYGFNLSHAVAYSCLSYLCMWFKHYYPSEWISAVLTGANKDDFKIVYPRWKEYIHKPDINLSKMTYIITSDNKVTMPLSHINGCGEKAAQNIIDYQPFKSFDHFLEVMGSDKVKKAKKGVNKEGVLSLIWAGAFDNFKPSAHYSENKWRKELAIKYYLERYKTASKAEKEEITSLCKTISEYTRGQIMMMEIQKLNFTSFDYHAFFDYYMTTFSKEQFGSEAIRPEDLDRYGKDEMVVIGGGVEEIKFWYIKSGPNKGKEMCKMKISNEGNSCEIVVFNKTLEQEEKGQGLLRKLYEQVPVIIKVRVMEKEGKKSYSYEEMQILVKLD